MKSELVQADKAWAGAVIIRLLRRWVAARSEGLNQIVTVMEFGAELNTPLMLPVALDSLFHLTEQCLSRPLEAECCCSLDYSGDERAILLLIWVVADTKLALAPLPEQISAAIERLESSGRTTMTVRMGDRYLGVIGLMDTPREAAISTLQELRRIGITRMIMISGDNQRVADAIAKQVGLDEAWGDLMPEDKVASIAKMKGEAKVAMVGDGVNDAPAMAHATVGIAMGAAGSDVALETADVALMADDLAHLPFAVGLSRQTSRIIRQNLYVSLGVVALLLPATIMGLGIGPAVLAHEGSTLVVVANALRLLAFRDRRATKVAKAT